MSLGMLGKYERIDVLGHGASGIVYLAQDTLLKKRVALKEINAQGEELSRVLEEARVLDRLNHPNIVSVNGVDTIGGKVVIDMEYVAGSNLLEILRRSDGPLPIDDAIAIAIQICDGLAYAHEQRTVHRDIKPANILVSDSIQVKLADFGLAQVLGTNSFTGGAGTYAYMAPEDFEEGGKSDRQSDIWSVGVILYEMLTGRRPFIVTNARDPFAWSRAISKEEIRPPSSYSPIVSQALDHICLKALERNRPLRYADAAVMARDLRSAQSSAVDDRVHKIVQTTPTVVDNHPEAMPTSLMFLGVSDIDELLLRAPEQWDELGESLANGSLNTWLNRIGEPLVARVASELEDGADDTLDSRLRIFLYRAGLDLEPAAREYARRGGELIGQSMYPEAVDTLQQAVKLDPARPSYHRLLAQAARAAGDMELARDVLSSALTNHPNDRNLRRDLEMIGGAAPDTSAESVDFGTLRHGQTKSKKFTIWANYADIVQGRIASAPAWASVTPLTFTGRGKQIFTVEAKTVSLSEEAMDYDDHVIIETSGGEVVMPMLLSVLPPQPEFKQIAAWYVPTIIASLLPAVAGEAATIALFRNGTGPSYSPAGLIASGLLDGSFLALNFCIGTRLYEKLAAAVGACLLPLGIYQLLVLAASAPYRVTVGWQTAAEALLLALLVPGVQIAALFRSRQILQSRPLWCGVIVIAAIAAAALIWRSTR